MLWGNRALSSITFSLTAMIGFKNDSLSLSLELALPNKMAVQAVKLNVLRSNSLTSSFLPVQFLYITFESAYTGTCVHFWLLLSL